MTAQTGILAPIPAAAHYVTLGLTSPEAAATVLDRLTALRIDDSFVVGIGESLARAGGRAIDGLRTFPALSGPGCTVPSTQAALFVQTRGKDAGESLATMRRVIAALGEGLRLEEDVVGYKHDIGRDLSGYEDGTENPKGDAAAEAALVTGRGAGLDGSSFVAAQRWVHDLAHFERFDAAKRDQLIGRERTTNVELTDPPATAHTKRSQQESFDPPGFMVRRSMPYGGVAEHGLYFVAYVATLDTFEKMMVRMAGIDDGIVDGLFEFSRPVSGGYYWCPPIDGGRLDLRALRR